MSIRKDADNWDDPWTTTTTKDQNKTVAASNPDSWDDDSWAPNKAQETKSVTPSKSLSWDDDPWPSNKDQENKKATATASKSDQNKEVAASNPDSWDDDSWAPNKAQGTKSVTPSKSLSWDDDPWPSNKDQENKKATVTASKSDDWNQKPWSFNKEPQTKTASSGPASDNWDSWPSSTKEDPQKKEATVTGESSKSLERARSKSKEVNEGSAASRPAQFPSPTKGDQKKQPAKVQGSTAEKSKSKEPAWSNSNDASGSSDSCPSHVPSPTKGDQKKKEAQVMSSDDEWADAASGFALASPSAGRSLLSNTSLTLQNNSSLVFDSISPPHRLSSFSSTSICHPDSTKKRISSLVDLVSQLETRLESAMLEKTKLESEYVLSIQALRSDCEQLRKQVFERSRTFTDDSTIEGDDAALLRLKLTEKEAQCVEFNRRLEALVDELAELRKQRDASMKVEFQLREQTTDMEQRLHVFEERVDQLTNEKKFFQERNGKYFDEKYEAQERVRELIKEKAEMEAQMKIAQEEVRQMSSKPRLSAVQRETVALQLKLSALEEKNVQLEKELADLKVAYEREKRSNDLSLVKRDEENVQRQNEMRELERQLHAAKLMCSELRASQSAAEHRADSARERANVLQRLLDDSKFRESKLLQQIGPAQVASVETTTSKLLLDKKETELTELRNANERLRNDKERLLIESKERMSSSDSLERELFHARAELEASRRREEDLVGEQSKLQEACDRLKSALYDQDAQINELERRLGDKERESQLSQNERCRYEEHMTEQKMKLHELEKAVLARTELEKRLEVAQASERRLTSELERRGQDQSTSAKAVESKLREVERARIELDVELRAAKSRLDDLHTQLVAANVENEHLQQQLGFLSGDNKVLKSGLEEAILKAENIAEERDDLRKQLEDLRRQAGFERFRLGSTVQQQSKLIKYIEERPDVFTAVNKKLDTKKHQTPSSSHSTAQSVTPYAVGSTSRPLAGSSACKSFAPIALRAITSASESGVVRSTGSGAITQTQTHLTHFSMQRRITVESPAPVPVPPFTSISSYASASATSVATMASANTVSTHSSRAALNAPSATGVGSAIPVRNERRRSRSGNAVLNEFRDMSSNTASAGPSGQPLKSVVSKATVQLRGIAPQCTRQYMGAGRTPFVAPSSSSGVATKENVAPVHSAVFSAAAPAPLHSGGYTKSVSAIPLPRQTSRYTVTVDESKRLLRPI